MRNGFNRWLSISGSDSYFVFQAEDGIRNLVRSRGLGYVYKRQPAGGGLVPRGRIEPGVEADVAAQIPFVVDVLEVTCLLYTSDAADDLPCVDLGGRRIIKKKQILS